MSATEQLSMYISIYQVTICCWDYSLSSPLTNLVMFFLRSLCWPTECLNSFLRSGTVFSQSAGIHFLPSQEKNINLNEGIFIEEMKKNVTLGL